MLLRRAPLFVRIFIVMLACAVTVQLVNFESLTYFGLPFPRLYAVSQVATALRKGFDPDGELGITVASTSPVDSDPRADRVRDALARAIGIPEDSVRVRLAVPLQGDSTLPLFGLHRPPRTRVKDLNDAFLVGDFTVAVRMAEGKWRVAHTKLEELPTIRYHLAIILFLTVLTIAPISWVVSRRLARPIALFASAAERLGRDPRVEPLAVDRYPPEVADAAGAFNRMQGRLNRYVDDRTLLIAAIAHDLRTPLMRLSLRLEHAPEPLRDASEADIADMQAMIASTTAFVRDTTEPPDRRRLDLRSLVEVVVDDLVDNGRPVSLIDGDPVIMEGDAAALKSLIANLVGNALNYAGNAQLSLAREDGHAVLRVRDTGPGIAEEHLDRVFEPFFRAEASRNRDTGGTGLGLASVRAVANAHGGRVTLSNHPEGGALAEVYLPI